MSSHFWELTYLIQNLLISTAIGCLAISSPRLLPVPRLSRFLIGFCLTPFLLGSWMLLLAAVLPRAPRWAFLAPPPIAAMAIIAFRGQYAFQRLFRRHRRTFNLLKMRWLAYISILIITFIITLVSFKLYQNVISPVDGYDALYYLGEALPFAQERSLSAINTFRDRPDGTLRGDWHNFLWPAYLSHALITTSSNHFGYPNDHAARVAFQITILYMLVSIVAFAKTVNGLSIGTLSLLLLFQVPQFEYISIACSRDGFRIIPLMVLSAILTGLSPQRLRGKLRPLLLISPLIMGIFCISGHTLGGMIALIIALAWVAWGLIYRTRISNQLLVLGALGMGLLVGGMHYLQAYHETGNFRGLKKCIVTKINTNITDRKLPSVGETNLQRMAILAGRDRYRISIPGTICAIMIVILGLKFRRIFGKKIPLFIGLLSLTTMTPFIGIYDFDIYNISDWFIENYRYQLHWYPFAVVCIAMVVGYGYRWGAVKNKTYIKISAGVGLAGLTFALSILAYDTISSKWRTRTEAKEWIEATINPLQTILQKMPVGKKLLLEDLRYNYYLRNRAIILYSSPTCEILRAEDEKQVKESLRDLNVAAVALKYAVTNRDLMGTALFDLLRNPQKASLTFVIRESSMQVYIIDEEMID